MSFRHVEVQRIVTYFLILEHAYRCFCLLLRMEKQVILMRSLRYTKINDSKFTNLLFLLIKIKFLSLK